MARSNFFGLVVLVIIKSVYLEASFLNNHNGILTRTRRDTNIDIYYGRGDKIDFLVSPQIRKQVVMQNKKKTSFLVINPNDQEYGVFNGKGSGAIFNEDSGLTYIIYGDKDKDVGDDQKSSMNLTDMKLRQKPESIENLLKNDTKDSNFMHEILEDLGLFGSGDENPLVHARNLIVHFITSLFHLPSAIIDFATNGWVKLRYGITALFKIFKWIDKVVALAFGCNSIFREKAIRLPLKLMLLAKNGIEVLVYILKPVARLIDFSKVLSSFFSLPVKALSLIEGLGGILKSGFSGMIGIVYNIIKFIDSIVHASIKNIAKFIKNTIYKIFEAIRRYFTTKPNAGDESSEESSDKVDDEKELQENKEEEINSIKEMKQIIDVQVKTFNTGEVLFPFRQLLDAAVGEGSYKVHGVDVVSVFKILNNRKQKSVISKAVKLFAQISHVLPLNMSMPHLVDNTIDVMYRPSGLRQIKLMEPSIRVKVSVQAGVRSYGIQNSERATYSEIMERDPATKPIIERYLSVAKEEGFEINPQIAYLY